MAEVNIFEMPLEMFPAGPARERMKQYHKERARRASLTPQQQQEEDKAEHEAKVALSEKAEPQFLELMVRAATSTLTKEELEDSEREERLLMQVLLHDESLVDEHRDEARQIVGLFLDFADRLHESYKATA